jgi:Protein of unknown function (DUF4058)
MPVHDWTRVEAGIFHHFHLEWIGALARELNRGLLPPDHYALAEQITSAWEPDVLTLRGPTNGQAPEKNPPTGIALAAAPPKVRYRVKTEVDLYAAKAKAVVIRHTSNHQIIAAMEMVSPGNKSSRQRLHALVSKAETLLRAGIHLLRADLFPPGPRDPQGIHKALWDEFIDNDFALPPDKPLTLAAYVGGPCPEAFVEPTAVGATLPEMPLFLSPEVYIQVPLEATYQSAWEAVPSYWRAVLTGGRNESL